MKNIYVPLRFWGIIAAILFGTIAYAGKDSSETINSRVGYSEIKKKSITVSPETTLNMKRITGTKGEGDDIGASVNFHGDFRFHARYRYLYESYPITSPYNTNNPPGLKPKLLEVGGFGNNEQGPLGGAPLLNLSTTINPTPYVRMGIGMGFNHIFTGSLHPDSTRSRITFGQTFGAYADFKTSIGTITVGGGNLWTGMSQLFSGWAQVRWNPFYRLPWDWSAQWGGSWSMYENTYNNGSVTNFDAAYASGGRTNGVVLQLKDLPWDLNFNLSYGVDGQTGLFQNNNQFNLTSGTKKTFGARGFKKFNKSHIGVTAIFNNGYIDNFSFLKESQYMYSADAHIVSGYFTFSGEFGATAFTSPFGKYNGDSAFFKWDQYSWRDPNDLHHFESGVDFLGLIEVKVDKKKFGMPISFMLYNLGPYYINSNSGTFNTSTYNNSASYIQVNTTWDVAMRKGYIADLGQTANNRRGVELSTSIEKGRFKVGIGTQVGQEIEKADSAKWNQVMFYHKVNPWSRAGFYYWTPRGGPYGKLLGNYIQLLERVPITDSVIDYLKTFNVFDIEARYKSTFLGKPVILTNYISYMSASDKFSPIPYFTNNAFVRVFYNEFMAYYQMFKNTVLVGHVAYQKSVANERTQLSPETGKPMNQETLGLGLGIDWNFAPMMGLYFREMWMTHRDRNFLLDHFEGFETTVEVKVMF